MPRSLISRAMQVSFTIIRYNVVMLNVILERSFCDLLLLYKRQNNFFLSNLFSNKNNNYY